MAHDIFISYSSRDKAVADAMCATLERRKIRCWIAPRDVLPGASYAESLIDAIAESRVFILVFSANANKSPQVVHEVERAVSKGIPVLPVRIEDVLPSKSMEYFISTTHWLDALTPPLEQHLQRLADTVEKLLTSEEAAKTSPSGNEPISEAESPLNSTPPQGPKEVGATQKEDKRAPSPQPWRLSILGLVLAALCLLVVFCTGGIALLSGGNIAAFSFLPRSTLTPTLTATPIQSPTVMMTPTASPIPWTRNLLDDFSSNTNEWPDIVRNTTACGTESFNLRQNLIIWKIQGKNECIWPRVPGALPPVSDFDVSADVLFAGSSGSDAGLIFRYLDSSNYYYFGFREDSKEFSVFVVQNGNPKTLLDWTKTPQIQPGKQNRPRVLGLGSHFIFFINGNEVAALDDAGRSSGTVGLGASVGKGETNTFQFLNFEYHSK
jgi:hypothetical protein